MAAPTQGLGGTDPTTGQQITNGTTIGNYVMRGGQWYEWRDGKMYAPNGMWTGWARQQGSPSSGPEGEDSGMSMWIEDQNAYRAYMQAYPQMFAPGGGWGGGTTSTYDAGGNLRGSAESDAYLNTSAGSSTLYPPTTPTSSPTPSTVEDTAMAATNYAGLIRKTMGDATTYTAENPPSAGPNLSTTFPNYDPNSNIEQHYKDWYNERVAKGEDPYDMEEFRQHEIRLGGTDPGAPNTATTNTGTPPAPLQPGTTPGTTPVAQPLTPPSGNGPSHGAANSDQRGYIPDPNNPSGAWIRDPRDIDSSGQWHPPGQVFNPAQRVGSAQDLLGNFQSPNIPNHLDLERLFPWITNPRMASENAMAQAGFVPGNSNPFTSFLGNELPDMANIARFQNILSGGGGQESDISAAMPRIMGGGITRATGQTLLPGMADLARRYRAGMGAMTPEQATEARAYFADPSKATADQRNRIQGFLNPGGLNMTQSAFAAKYLDDPANALKFIGGLQNLAPDLRGAMQQVQQNQFNRFSNVAGGTPNASIWDFLGY